MSGTRKVCTTVKSLARASRVPVGRQPYATSRGFASQLRPRTKLPFSQYHYHQSRRWESTSASGPAATRPLTDRPDKPDAPNTAREDVPSYELTFTCRKCLDRSSHRVSKQSYHHGTTLITCPGCKNRHLISDHLKIFSDKSRTLEDILKEKGQLLKKGTLSAEGDVEFWDDGTKTERG